MCQDASLLSLVADLRSSGTCGLDKLDPIGLESAANQGFSTWTYQTLVPTLYDRYYIKNCKNGSVSNFIVTCPEGTPPSGPGVIPAAGGTDFTTIAQPYTRASTPCLDSAGFPPYNNIACTFNLPPSDLLNQIWGPVTSACSYVPGETATKWVFGSCSAGVDVNTSIGANTWGFTSHTGDPLYLVQTTPSTPRRAPGHPSCSAGRGSGGSRR